MPTTIFKALRRMIAAALFLVVSIAILRVPATLDQNVAELDNARMLVANEALGDMAGRSGVLYLGFDSGDPLPKELQQLSERQRQLELQPYSKRTEHNDWCKRAFAAPCMKDDFLVVSYEGMLLWRTAAVRWRTTACSGTYILIRALDRWWKIPEYWNWSCI